MKYTSNTALAYWLQEFPSMTEILGELLEEDQFSISSKLATLAEEMEGEDKGYEHTDESVLARFIEDLPQWMKELEG